MISQFKQDLYNKNFSLQDQGKDDEIDTLQKRIKFWLNIINMGEGPIPDYLSDYDITMKDWIILSEVQRYFLRLQNLKNYWTYSDVNDSEINLKFNR